MFYYGEFGTIVFIYLLVAICIGVGCAFGCKAIMLGKGYQESEITLYFWLGFVLQIIGIIIAVVMPSKKGNSPIQNVETLSVKKMSVAEELLEYKKLLDAGGLTDVEYNKKKKELLETLK